MNLYKDCTFKGIIMGSELNQEMINYFIHCVRDQQEDTVVCFLQNKSLVKYLNENRSFNHRVKLICEITRNKTLWNAVNEKVCFKHNTVGILKRRKSKLVSK